MNITRSALPSLFALLCLQGCTLDFDAAFDQTDAAGASDAAATDQTAGDGSQAEASPPADSGIPDQALSDRADSGSDTPPDQAPDTAPDVPGDGAPDVLPDVSPDVSPDVPLEVSLDVAPDVLPDVPLDVSCGDGFKACGGKCVSLDLPEYGCASTACTPCSIPNAIEGCSGMGTCMLASCEQGYQNCNFFEGDGCETSLTTVSNCGGCYKSCILPHSNETCSTGTCKVSTCSNGWGNCDGDDSDGCETALTSKTNCGACGQTCDLPNASESCSTGTCRVSTCSSGWGNCDNNHTNGCETPLDSSPNCGACGETCQSLPNVGSGACSSGACMIDYCLAGYANCDGVGSTGCETDISTDASNCGGCGNVCLPSSPNHTVACVDGGCVTGGCRADWGDCNTLIDNGCESFLFSDRKNCGSCGVACGNSEVCVGGHCASSCSAGAPACIDSLTTTCGSNVAAVGQYTGGDRIVCIDRGDASAVALALLSYETAHWKLTGAVERLSGVQVYSVDPGTTCEGAGAALLGIQIGGSVPADPYTYGPTLSDCTTHTGYAGAVLGAAQTDVCDMNCTTPAYCLRIDP